MIVLASKSASRRAVLTGAGVPFEPAVSGVDEDAVKAALLAEGAGPREVAEVLAEQKALRVSEGRPELVIGSDQTLDLDGALYDKVDDVAAARERLKLLRGKTHKLHNGLVLAQGGQVVWREVTSARLTMRDFSDAYLENYLASEGEAALGSVGCYRLEGPGAQLFSRIEGDYFGILGLPLMGLFAELRRRGELPA